MTGSELQTNICSSDKFLQRFVYSDIKTKSDFDTEKELCDCLLEFKNAYIVIQIKEKDKKSSNSFHDWFENKVLNKAKKQIKDSIKQMENPNNKFYSKGKEISIDKTKKINYIIVFDAEKIDDDYKKYYISQTGVEINIFSLNDFERMLDNLIVPTDIFDFLSFRKSFYLNNSLNMNPLVIDNISSNITLLGRIGSDIQVSDYFILKRYKETGINVENVQYFNYIVHEIEKVVPDDFDTLELLMSFNRNEALNFVDLWKEAINNSQKNDFVLPTTLHSTDDLFICFAKPINCSVEIYNENFDRLVNACFEEFKCKNIRMFVFEYASKDQVCISGGTITRESLKKVNESK